MHALDRIPVAEPGTPDIRSGPRLLLWIASEQKRLLGIGIAMGTIWMGSQALIPAAVGAGINAVTAKDVTAVAWWALAVLVLGITQAVAGVARHRYAVACWMSAASRIQQLVARRASDVGADLPLQVATGEVVAVAANDVERIGSALDICARFFGAIISFVVVAIALVVFEPVLGLIVVIGVPVLGLGVLPLVKPLERREAQQRKQFGEATELAADTVAGLRILRGVGGEDLFLERFDAASQRVRRTAVRVARLRSVLDALQVALPGILVVLVLWVGAHLALEGRLSAGALVAFYGYAAFLVLPLSTVTEGVTRWASARAAADRAVRLLALDRSVQRPEHPAVPPDGIAGRSLDLVDTTSGLRATAGLLTAVVAADPHEASELADRLGGYVAGAELGGVPLAGYAPEDVRRLVLVQDKNPQLLAGTVRDNLAVPSSGPTDDARLLAAIDAADAEEVLEGLQLGLDEHLPEKARSLSGGQRQRLALARSLVADPPVLVLDEPTSSVDAHTESRIAAQLREARLGRTTVVMATSPLILERADVVALLVDGHVVATGRHADLLRDPGYRNVVLRSTGDDDLTLPEPSGASR